MVPVYTIKFQFNQTFFNTNINLPVVQFTLIQCPRHTIVYRFWNTIYFIGNKNVLIFFNKEHFVTRHFIVCCYPGVGAVQVFHGCKIGQSSIFRWIQRINTQRCGHMNFSGKTGYRFYIALEFVAFVKKSNRTADLNLPNSFVQTQPKILLLIKCLKFNIFVN